MSRYKNPLFYTWLVRNAPEDLLERLAAASGKPIKREHSWDYRANPFDPLNGVSLVRFGQDKEGEARLSVRTAQPSFSMQRVPDFDAFRIATLGEPTTECVFVEPDPGTILLRYMSRLAGLCTATQALTYTPDDPKALLPDGLRGLDLVDVTGGLTDAHIANIPDLRENDPQKIIARENIANATAHDVKMIVLTGDQDTASKTMDALRQSNLLASKAHFVPQTAQLVAEQLGFGMKAGESTSRDSAEATIRYYRALRAITFAFEAISRAQAKAAGKGFLITNGGTVDHVGDPLNDGLVASLGPLSTPGMTSADRYHTILALDPVWGNPSKTATAEDVFLAEKRQARSLRQMNILDNHPGFRYVVNPNDVDGIIHEVVFGPSRHS